ncbi:Thiamine-monophosphate kinase [Desulfovibrionales bacterium]
MMSTLTNPKNTVPTSLSGRLDNENAFLACIDRHFPTQHQHLLLGRGDDCSLLATPTELLLTTDLFLENVHFRRRYFSPADIGHKALAINLSDIAAMGGRPLGFTMGLVVPMGPPVGEAAYWDALLAGMATLAISHGLPLAGGDLSRGNQLGISITLWGVTVGRCLRRGTGHPGDLLFIVSPLSASPWLSLGLAATGLALLEGMWFSSAEDTIETIMANQYPEAMTAHLHPEPLLTQGQILSSIAGVNSLIDISDGLAADLPRLIGPGLGAELSLNEDWLHPALLGYAAQTNCTALDIAVNGGEDYALLGTAHHDALTSLQTTIPNLRVLGKITAEPGIIINSRPLILRGFDHFSPGRHITSSPYTTPSG